MCDVLSFVHRFQRNMESGKLREKGFCEVGTVDGIEVFGDVAHVFSAYECSHAAGSGERSPLIARGRKSVQLIGEGGRWWVASLSWDEERGDSPLPPGRAPQEGA